MWRAPSPNRRRSLSASMAARTRSRLSSGSPMPMNTMLVSRLPSADEAARGEADLVDDLGDLEVPPEPELPGGAERAAHGAAGLARDAQRVPLPRAGTRRVVHQHRFDQRAVGQPVERLLGETAVRLLPLGIGDGVEPERGLEVGAQAGGQRPDLVDRRDRPLPDRIGDLSGAVGGHRALRQPGRQCLRGHAGQAGPLRGRVGAHAAMLAQAVTGPARWRCPRSTVGHAGRRPTASAGHRPAGPR